MPTPAPTRRRWLGLALGSALGLGGCGFALRQRADLAFKTVYADMAARSNLGVSMRRQLLGAGLQVFERSEQAAQADIVLQLKDEVRRQVVVGMTPAGQVRELQLRAEVTVQVLTPAGLVLIEPVRLEQQRDLSFTESAALSKDIEQAMLSTDMDNELVQQIMRRLSRLKMPAAARP